MKKPLVPIALLFLPTFVFAAPNTFDELVSIIVGILNYAVLVLVTLALAVYFLGVSANLFKIKEDAEARKRFFFWGIVVLFVMVSVWGILKLVENTILGGSGGFENIGPGDFGGSDPFGFQLE